MTTTFLAMFAAAALFSPAPQTTARVSVTAAGAEANGPSQAGFDRSISADGRFIAFSSEATDLVPGDTNAVRDVFVIDRDTDGNGVFDEPGGVATERVSVSSSGAQAGGLSTDPSMSPDGRWVAFESIADDLVASDTNGIGRDVFVHDRTSGTTVLVSRDTTGVQGMFVSFGASISADGRFVAFLSLDDLTAGEPDGYVDNVFQMDVYMHDRDPDGNLIFDEPGSIATRLISVNPTGFAGDGPSNWPPSISADGSRVSFESLAKDLLPGPPHGDVHKDIFVRDVAGQTTTLVSRTAAGDPGGGASTLTSISAADGRYVAFQSEATDLVPGDTNGLLDVFVFDLVTGNMERISLDTAGGNPDGHCGGPSISADGRWVAYDSTATDLVAGDANGYSDVFLHDRDCQTTVRVSVASGGGEADDECLFASISAGGEFVVYESAATTLDPPDVLGHPDVYVHDRRPAVPTAFCTAKTNSLGCLPAIGFSGSPSASSGAPFVIDASNVLNNKNGILFYGPCAKAVPFQGGWRCVKQPLRRTPLRNSNGNPPPNDCSGVFAYEFNARIQSGVDANLVAGAVIFAQYWYRDPAAPFTTGLSDALAFTIAP